MYYSNNYLYQYLTCKVLAWQREASHTQCFKTIAIEKYI